MDESTLGLTRRDSLRRGGVLLAGLFGAGCSSAPESDDGTDGDDGDPAGGTTDGSDGGAGTDPESGNDELPDDVAVDHDETDWERYDPDWETPTSAPTAGEYTVETLAENLEIPWDISVTSSGELFLTERTGQILTFDSGSVNTVATPGDVIDAEAIGPGEEGSWLVEGGEGGLLGIAAHPTYPDPPLVYTYFTADTDDGRKNRVVAFDASADAPAENVWPIVTGIPAGTFHNGGRIEFGPANYLWIATGDADPPMENTDRTRDPGSLAGKILRVNPDGSAPADNPDIDGDADPRVYTYRHRNPQGISWLPDATPVIAEHGPGQGDEINVLRAGENYGWPDARSGSDFASYADTDYQPPVADAPSWAPAGSLFYTGDAVPALQNRLLVGGLVSQQLVAVTITGEKSRLGDGHDQYHDADWMDAEYHAASDTLLSDELGRIRHVEQGRDGTLYAVTSNRDGRASGEFPTERDDRLVRITPE